MLTAYFPSPKAHSAPAPDDFCVPVVDTGVFLLPDSAGGWRLPTTKLAGRTTDIAALGTVHGRPVWAATLPRDEAVSKGLVASLPAKRPTSREDLRPSGLVRLDWAASLAQPDANLTRLLARAVAVMTWRRTHRFCGACGTPLVEIDWGRTCPSCGLATFGKAQPVALVAVWRMGPTGRREVLLAKHTYGGARHLWALVGGYLDPAESLDEAAHREVAEEVDLRITELTYFGSEAWGLNGPGVLLTVYTARSEDPRAEPVVDGNELAEARFFPVDQLPDPVPPAHLIATRVLTHLASLPLST